MKLRVFLIGAAVLFTASATKAMPPFGFVNETALDASSTRPAPVTPFVLPAVPSTLVAKDKVLASAYYDTFFILSTDNSCSEFFGGPDAVYVFDKLMASVRKQHFSNAIAMRMSGVTNAMRNYSTQMDFRTFENVALNTNGPFYRKRFSHNEPSMPKIGNFEPNTREVRALILLHELGHVVKGKDGQWLLPDDGRDEGLSRDNSLKVLTACNEQLKELREGNAPMDLAAKQKKAPHIAQVVPATGPTPGNQP